MMLFLLTVTAALLHPSRSQSTPLAFDGGLSNGAFGSGVGGGSLNGLGSFPSEALLAGLGSNPGLGHLTPQFPSSSLLPFSAGLGSPLSNVAGVAPFSAGTTISTFDLGGPFSSFSGVPNFNGAVSNVGFNGLSGFLPLPSPLAAPAAFQPFSSSLPAPLAPFPSALGSSLLPLSSPPTFLSQQSSTLHLLSSNAGIAPFTPALGFPTPNQGLRPFA